MRLHHLALRTFDLERLEAFYAGVLGLAVLQRRPGSVWLDGSGVIVMLESADAEEPRVAASSRELVAFRIEPHERGAMEARLAAAHVPRDGATAFTLYARDPDGRRVGFSHYPDVA